MGGSPIGRRGGSLLLRPDRGAVDGLGAQLLLDPQELVVLGDPVGPAGRPGLDLAGVGGHGDVGDGGVLGLARAVADDRAVLVALGHLDRVEGLGQGADLVDLHQDAVGDRLVDPLLEPPGVGDEEVVADELAGVADGLGQQLPALPVVLRAAVLDRDDGVLFGPADEEVDHLGDRLLGLGVVLQGVDAVLEELGRGDVEGEGDVGADLVPGLVDGGEDDLDGLLVALEVGGEPPFVADGGVVALGLEHGLEVVEHLGAAAEGLGEAFRPEGDDHELLDVDVVIRVRAAVEDVHERDGQDPGVDAAEVAVERQARGDRGGLGGGEADAEDRVGAQLALVLGAVGGDQGGVEGALLGGVHADGGLGERAVDVGHRLRDTLAQVALLVAVAELDRLVGAGAGPRGHGGPAERAVGQDDVDLDGRVAPAVEDLASEHRGDG